MEGMGKRSQPAHVYHGDGAGEQEGELEGRFGEGVVCGRSGCCGGEWVGNAGSTVGVEGGIWEAWAEDEYGMEKAEVMWVTQQRK